MQGIPADDAISDTAPRRHRARAPSAARARRTERHPSVAIARPKPGWREILSRGAAAVIGGYTLTYCLAAFLSVYFPLLLSGKLFAVTLSCAAYAGSIIYAFRARHHAWAWGGLMVASVVLSAAAFIPASLH